MTSSGVTGVCGSGIIDVVAEMFLAGLIDADGTICGELAARTRAHRRRRPHVLLRAARRRRHPADDHPERRAGDPARQGRAARRHRPARRARRLAGGHRHPPGRRVRRPHRPCPRDGARSGARLPGRGRAVGRQRRRRRRRAGAAVAPAAGRDGGRRAPGHQDRDRHRAAVPGAVRRGDGASARHEPVAEPGDRGRPSRSRHPMRRVAGAVAVGSAPNRRPTPRTAVPKSVMEDVS